jgi:hypothetical protein
LILVDVGDTVPDMQIIGGQSGVTFNSNNTLIDLSSKDQPRSRSLSMGRLAETVTLNGMFVRPELGIDAVRDALRNGTQISILRRRLGVDVEEATAFVVTNDEDFPDQAPATYSMTFEIDGVWGPPTST